MSPRIPALTCGLLLLTGCGRREPAVPVEDHLAYHVPPLSAVTLTDSFWRPRLERNRTVTIPHILERNEQTGRVANFRRAAGRDEGAYAGRRFNDTDVYKVIEAASYALASHPDPALAAEVDELVDLIAAAQEKDGYLMPARTIDPGHPAPGLGSERWIHVSTGSHELYNAGHLIEAAVAHWRATGKRTLLDVALRLADRIDEDFGPRARHDVPGHEEIELALVELAEAVDEPRYLDLARFFLEQRGRRHDGEPYPEDTPFALYNDRDYRQDDRRVTEQTEAHGHAVRATYLWTGMADVAARTEADGYEEALERVWHDLVETKLYLTGGIGSRDTFESFGEPWELPNDTAYAETCAAIGNDLWNHRMFLATGRADYLDVMERILYNGFLSGVSLSGDRFFYTNPLASEGGVERSDYFEVACCPANLARMMARLPTFLYAAGEGEIVVSLYVGSEADLQVDGIPVHLEVTTDYPWTGRVELAVSRPRRAR
ncbi:MAG: glycoside hydrolase family 127 protein [Thermoanaerobaculia bacterium]